MLELICSKLGIEIGEEWKGNDYDVYKIDKDGNLHIKDVDVWKYYNEGLPNLLSNNLYPIWQPRFGEFYFVPNIPYAIIEEDRYEEIQWLQSAADYTRWENGLVFKTAGEAVAAANEMLAFWRGK